MAYQLPAAPKSFYDPSLIDLKDALDATNGSTKGQIALITAVPDDIENPWADVGVAGDTTLNINRGQYVIGNKDIGLITGPIDGPIESGGELGYKLQFDPISQVPIYIDGTGVSTAIVIGASLCIGVDVFSSVNCSGFCGYMRYLIGMSRLTVTDSTFVDIPGFEIIINYSESI